MLCYNYAMERIGMTDPKYAGDVFGESYGDVRTKQDIFTLWRNAISFVGNPDVSRKDLFKSMMNDHGIMEDGTIFEKTKDAEDSDRITFSLGSRKATIILDYRYNSAIVLKQDAPES
jgi:hypothetical protein